MQAIFELNQAETWNETTTKVVERNTVKRTGWLASLFGCWHQELTRPFTTERESYRACTTCGARRQFNTETLETHGPFYFSPSIAGSDN